MSVFIDCVKDYLESISGNISIKEKDFFNNWFRIKGKAYTFVFEKNLKVTNIQFAELIALIKMNAINKNSSKTCEMQFLSVKEFKEKIVNLIQSYFAPYNNIHNIKQEYFECFESYYSSIFESIIAIDTFYGSCAVFAPYNLEIDIKVICGLSGYIHSCGQNVFTRKAYRLDKVFFFNSLKKFIDNNYERVKSKIPFVLYSREDFEILDSEEIKSILQNGLEDHKFHIEKFYIQSQPLISVIEEIENDEYFSKKLRVIKTISEHNSIKSQHYNSIWLIIDRSVDPNQNVKNPGEDVFIICYNQLVKNENPFHFFDENKPGWIDHTTIPHSLVGAMLNISLDFYNNEISKKEISIFDPFVGAGTTYLETLKYKNIEFKGSDLSPLSKMAIKDNVKFFSMPIKRLISLLDTLIMLENYLNDKIEKPSNKGKKNYKNNIRDIDKTLHSIVMSYRDVRKFFRTIIHEKDGTVEFKKYEENDVEKLFTNMEDRILYYIYLRTFKRNFIGIKRKARTAPSAFIKELTDFNAQFKNYLKMRKREEHALHQNREGTNLRFYPGNYSLAQTINHSQIVKDIRILDSFIFNSCDAVKELEYCCENNIKFDIIITDPPYGFNTNEDLANFSMLYNKLFELMIKCLNDHGQIILCLPDASFIGRQINYFTLKEIIINQILMCAAKNDKEVIRPCRVLPFPSKLYKPPFYWESEKALRRAILHFVIKSKCDN